MARQFTGQHYVGADGIFHYPWVDTVTGESGEELSYEGPSQGAQAAPASAPPAAPVPVGTWNLPVGSPGNTFNYGASLGQYPGGYGTPWNNPWSIGAGTSEVPYGWGVPGFHQDPIQIRPEYMEYLNSMMTGERGGYIPGSGTLNNFRLDQPGLLGTVAGVPNTNLRYGMGGTGDPTTGLEAQTPDQWVQGGPLFEWQLHSQGKLPRDVGMDPLTTLFMRSDTPSGINTAAWSAPPQNWAQLSEAIAKGYVKPTERGWQALAQKNITPQSIGGAAPGMAGAGGAGGQGGQGGIEGAYASIIAMQQAQVAAQITHLEWTERTGDERLAMEKATEAFRQKFAEVQQAFSEKTTAAGMTGQWEGAPTMAYQQQQWAQGHNERQLQQQIAAQQQGTALNLLQLGSQLRGPQNYAQYLQTLGQTPQGLRDLVGGLAGQYKFAGSTGAAGPTQGASLQGLTQDLLSGGNQGTSPMTADRYRQETSGLPSPNQINLQNWGNLTPTGQSLALNAYESQGWDPNDVQKMLAAAAPRYTGAGAQAQLTV